MHSIYVKANKHDPCFLMDWISKPAELAKRTKDFFIVASPGSMAILKYFNSAYQKDLFISPSLLTEAIVYFLSKRSKRMNRMVRAVFNHYVNIVHENGFAKKAFIDLKQMTDDGYPSFKRTFHSKQEYLEYHTHQIKAVTIEDFG